MYTSKLFWDYWDYIKIVSFFLRFSYSLSSSSSHHYINRLKCYIRTNTASIENKCRKLTNLPESLR